jgi:hypothetical protein
LVAGKTFGETDDIYVPGLVLWDCKMAKEMRSMFNTLRFNYSTLEEIVLEATGAVAETPHTPGYISLYV